MNVELENQRTVLLTDLYRAEAEYSLRRAVKSFSKEEVEAARISVVEGRQKLASHYLGVYLANRKVEIPNFYPSKVDSRTISGWAHNIVDAIQVHKAILVLGPNSVVEAVAGVWWENKIPSDWRPFFAEFIKAIEWKYNCVVTIGVDIEFC